MRVVVHPAAGYLIVLAFIALASGCVVLPTPPLPLPGPLMPSTRTVTCITRTLADGLHLQVLEHRVRVAEPSLVAFLDAYPGLDGHLMLQDLLFLERLAESSRWELLLASGAGRGQAASLADPAPAPGVDQPDRLDPVDRLKVALIRDALGFPSFLAAIAGGIGDDALDPSSEHGGLVLLESGEGSPLRLLAIPSTSADDDHAYGLPPELFTAACLAIWHDHAFDDQGRPAGLIDNPRAAGPSGAVGPSLVSAWGDRWIAFLRGIDGLVFSPTGGGGFGVVFYSTDGGVCDLGRYALP